MASTQDTRAFKRLIWMALALGALSAAAMGWTLLGLRRDTLAAAAREQQDVAKLLGEEISFSNRGVEAALDRIEALAGAPHAETAAEFRSALGTPAVAATLAQEQARAERIDAISIIAADGDVIAASRPAQPSASVAHEAGFVYLTNHRFANSYISAPIYNRSAGAWLIHFARQIYAANGGLVGVVAIGVRLDHYRDIYSAISALKGKSVELIRADGERLVSLPAPIFGEDGIPAASPWRALVAAGGGSFRLPAGGAGAKWVTVQPLAALPLIVAVGQSEAEILGPWRTRSLQIGLGGLLALTGAGFLARSAARLFTRLARSEASLAERGRELAKLNDRFSLVLDTMPHGVALYHRGGRLIVANRRYAEMYGLRTSDLRPGLRLREILAKRVANGFHAGDGETYIRKRLVELERQFVGHLIDRMVNGRIYAVSRWPINDGGWLTIHEDITERQLAEDRVTRMALTDQLTGVANRATLLREMRAHFAAGDKLTALLVDLDEFKAVNDTRGHPFGDLLLIAVARRLEQAAGEGALVARLGGDEFAVLAINPSDDGAPIANALLNAIRAPFEIEGTVLSIRPSVGVARAPADGAQEEALLKSADLALYAAKTGGRDRIAYYDPALEGEIRETRRMKADIAEALARSEFELNYQPIVDARSRQIIEFEALARWRRVGEGPVSPDRFIAIAEESGLIHALGEFVLNEACAAAANWPAPIGVAVNLSPAQLARGDVVEIVERALARSGLAPQRLTLELTETALMNDVETAKATLAALRARGVSVALDDFGVGYSSLSQLQNFTFDKIKIDRAFIAAMTSDPRTRDIVALIAAIARTLGARTICEGIETEAHLELILAAGCSAAQGYWIAKPAPLEALTFERAAA